MALIYYLYSTTLAILSQRNLLKGYKVQRINRRLEALYHWNQQEPKTPTGPGTRRATATQHSGTVSHCSGLCFDGPFLMSFGHLLKITIPEMGVWLAEPRSCAVPGKGRMDSFQFPLTKSGCWTAKSKKRSFSTHYLVFENPQRILLILIFSQHFCCISQPPT